MSWGDELDIIRRFLRDPGGAIWSEAYLRHEWNDVQQDLQNRTGYLEEVAVQRVPGLYQGAFLFDWESRYLDVSVSYRALTRHDQFAICGPWEAQETTGIAGDADDPGAHFTQPWEAYMATPGELVRMRWPRNFHHALYLAYDDESIGVSTRKSVQSRDSSYLETQGTPTCLYSYDQDHYVLYPRPSVSFSNELDGEGVATFADGDTEDATTGTIGIRTASYDAGEGVSVDIIDSADNLFVVYRVRPTDVESMADEPDFPAFLRRYIRFGVVGRAYAANTDGRIRSLGDLWEARYELGVEMVKRYMRNRRQDRDYRFGGQPTLRPAGSTLKLPDTYPAT